MRRPWAVLTLIAVVALALRVAFLAADPQPYEAVGLSTPQGEVARNIVDHGRWLVLNERAPTPRLQQEQRKLIDPSDVDFTAADSDSRYVPLLLHGKGVALVLAGLWKVTGDKDYGYVQALQALAGALSVLLIWWIAMQLYARPRAALLAAGIYALHFPIAHQLRLPYYDPWAVLLAPVILALLLKARAESYRASWLLAAGAAAGVAAAFRPPLVVMMLGVVAALALVDGGRRAVRAGAISLAAAVVLIGPWTVVNAVEYDAFIPVHTGFGQVLWQGLGEHVPNAFGAAEDDDITLAMVERERPALRYGTVAYDDYLRDKAIDAIADHPGEWAVLVGKRLAKSTILLRNGSWAEEERTRFEARTGSIASFVLEHPLDSLRLAVAALLEPALFLAALLTLLLTWRGLWRSHLPLLGVVAGVMAVVLVLGFQWRYVVPASFAWIVIAAVGADSAAARLAARWR